MSLVSGKGSYIGGRFVSGTGEQLVSYDPSRHNTPVFVTTTDTAHVDIAVQAALHALPAWSCAPERMRIEALGRLKERFIAHEQAIATSIALEMGKPLWESTIEAKSLAARIDLMIQDGLRRVATEHPKGVAGETRYHAQGALVVLGPYNFPAHLVNAHVIPALLTGNTVVVKPSEVCPQTGELYAQCVHEAQLPPGVFNMVQGRGDVGQALVTHPRTHGVLFTGSYATGRRIAELLLDQPHKICALEMGGKNCAVVLNDADPYQAVIDIVQGAFLTTGQRCTATSRVLVTKRIAQTIIDGLVRATRQLKPLHPFDPLCVFGPLATVHACEQYWQKVTQTGCDVLVAPRRIAEGAFVTPSLHQLDGHRSVPGYTDTELFGPDICVQVVDNMDHAIHIVNESPFGLSNALFTAQKSHFEHFFYNTRCGVLNWNKSTNGASGHLPFGGVGKSGNQRAAGIDAVRYTTYPVAINWGTLGEYQPIALLRPVFENIRSAMHVSSSKAPLVQVERLTKTNWPQYASAILALESNTFEQGRQDTHATLQAWVDHPDSICLVMTGIQDNKKIVMGYAFGGPLELSDVDGPLQDPMRGQHNTYLSANIVLAPQARGHHLGVRLKREQIQHVSACKKNDGTHRYHYMTGRNRVGATAEMTHINRAFGAKTVAIYHHQYGIQDAQALYYRIDLRPRESV